VSEERINALVDAMTAEEKITLIAGRDSWTTAPIERLGIPSIKVTDGPNGARGGGSFVGGVTAAAFPVAISLSSSWNVELVNEIGVALADEARAKGARVLLAPTVNMHRSTLNGRNFECYSEDPHLTSEIAIAYINGVQSRGVAATVKHFIGNESEYERHTISSDIDERSLREIYMPPFEAAVKRAGPWALMTSYNRLDGTYVSERSELVNGVLKGEWGFDGVAMSDWFGAQSTLEALDGGLDLEMPGPPRHRGEKLLAAHRAGKVSEGALREAALRMLRLIDRVGGFENPEIAPERAEDKAEVRALIRRAGAEGIVLLKNDGALPLTPRTSETWALIGPNAETAQIMGGGSAQLNPHYRVTPAEGLRAALPESITLTLEIGADNRRLAALYEGDVEIEYFEGVDFAGAPVHKAANHEGIFMFFGLGAPGFAPNNFSARMRSRHPARTSGDHEFSLISSGRARLTVNGEVLIDAWTFKLGKEYFNSACDEVRGRLRLQAGAYYDILVEYAALPDLPGLGVTVLRLGLNPVLGDAALERAVALAASADKALLFVGLNGEWDGEGMDRPDIDLPGRQNELIARVAAVNPNTIVVLQSGSPVAMPWLDKVAAVLQAWYPGQEAGSSIADVLLGKAEPSGRLPQTFPHRLEDDPAYINYPGERGHVRYGEGIFIGYRYYEKKQIETLFPFGFGLSYTRFECGELKLSTDVLGPGDTLDASIEVTNVGVREGSTVVQFYVVDEQASVARPRKELARFAKVRLAPGETRSVSTKLGMRSLAFFDVAAKSWTAEAGRFVVLAGFSSADVHARAAFTLSADWIDDSPRRAAAKPCRP
jgi:beta-glucosidase